MDELKRALRERDDRIAFLEKELIQTRLELASARTLEDRLFHELNKMSAALSKTARARSRLQDPPIVTGAEAKEDTGRLPMCRPFEAIPTKSIVSGGRNSMQDAISSSEPRRTSLNVGDTALVPLGKPLISHGPNHAPMFTSRKIIATKRGCSWKNLNPGSCSSGLDLLNFVAPSGGGNSGTNLNPGSCSSALDLLKIFVPSGGGNAKLSSNPSGDSSNMTAPTLSKLSLKKRKSGDTAAGQRRTSIASVGNYKRNDDWADVFSVSASSARPQGNMFLDCLQPDHPLKKCKNGDMAAVQLRMGMSS